MRMYFKQRFLTLLDSYDIYDEDGNVLYTVQGRFSLGHNLDVYDCNGVHVGQIKQELLTFLPKFNIYLSGVYMGRIMKEFSFFYPRYNIEFNGWHIEGDWTEWDYAILDGYGRVVADISKDLWHFTDHYIIECDQENALMALMVVLAIDCEKCSRQN